MYALIGAGPMGLAAARNLQKYDIPFTGFELHSDVGGLWDIDNPHSTMYDSAHLISSRHMTEFKEFPMAKSGAPYPHHSELRQYFRDFAQHFRLYPHYRFNTKVIDASPLDNGGWRIVSEQHGKRHIEDFDGLLIANGTLHHPNAPALPGEYTGELMHSADYRNAEVFANWSTAKTGLWSESMTPWHEPYSLHPLTATLRPRPSRGTPSPGHSRVRSSP